MTPEQIDSLVEVLKELTANIEMLNENMEGLCETIEANTSALEDANDN